MIRTIKELNISKKHKNQLRKARDRHSNDFATRYLAKPIEGFPTADQSGIPHLFTREDGGFLHFDLEELLSDNGDFEQGFDWQAIQKQATMFTNPMELGEYDPNKRVKGTHSGGTPPSERVANAGWIVLTYEYDGTTPHDLEMQLDWFSGKPETCPFAAVHKAFSAHADYRGYASIFSGGKSLHINLVFDIRHLLSTLFDSNDRTLSALWTADVPNTALAALHRKVWVEGAEIINTALGTSIKFDTQLQSYVQKRRSPWGMRTLAKRSKLHGFDAGDQVEQIVVQERLSQRTLAVKGASALFTHAKAKALISHGRQSHNRPSARQVTSTASQPLLAALQSYLTSNGWDNYPKPVDIQFDGTHNYLFFQNDAADVHPCTLVRGDYRKLLWAGKATTPSDLFLPNNLTLDETIDLLSPNLSSSLPNNPNSQPNRSIVPLQHYKNKAVDVVTARDYGGRILKQIGDFEGVTLIQGPEGVGKTHSMFNVLKELRWDDDAARVQSAEYRDVEVTLKRGFNIISCKSHEQLDDKCQELLKLEDGPAHAVVIKSLSRLYAEALSTFPNTEELSSFDAGQHGFGSLIQAIQTVQPDVYSAMKDLRDDMWRLPNGQVMFQPNAVVFMVHGLLQVWPHAQNTKAFLHPDFPDDFDPAIIEEYAKQMQAYRVIYDEVSWGDLATMYPVWTVSLAHDAEARCKASSGKPWDEAALSARTSSYQSAMQHHSRKAKDLPFENCDQIIRSKVNDDCKFHVDKVVHPFGKGRDDKNMYAQSHGNTYYCKPKRWFTSLGCPIAILTTEDLPRLIMKSISALEPSSKISVVNMTDTPHLFKDMVLLKFEERTRLSRRTSKDGKHLESVLDLAQELLSNGTDFVISNGLKDIPTHLAQHVSTHESVRGRNDLVGKRIATLVSYPAVSEYENYCILGSAFGIDNPIGVAYRDIVYQDLGRNLGFRYTTGQAADSHVVYIKSSLYRDLNRLSGQSGSANQSDRYQFYLTS